MCSLSEPHGEPPARGDEVQETILGGAPRYTKKQVAEAAGVPVQRAEQLWQAMGFAHVTDEAVVFTDSDVAALRSLVELVSADVIPPELETAVARSLAQTMSRLAEWQVEIFKQLLGEEFAVDVETTAQMASVILPVMARLQDYVWRRHLAASASREMAERDAGTDERVQVIGFADLVGYTRLIRDFSAQAGELEELIDGFEALAWGVVAENHGRVIKTIGDEVLFVTDTAADAAEIALTLNERVAENDLLPPLRIGMAEGPVLARFGDVYGSTVNAASRLTSAARPASALVDRDLAMSLRGNPKYRLISLGPQKVQGFRGLRAWALRRAK